MILIRATLEYWCVWYTHAPYDVCVWCMCVCVWCMCVMCVMCVGGCVFVCVCVYVCVYVWYVCDVCVCMFEVGDVFLYNFQTSWLDQEGLPKTLLSGASTSSSGGAKGSSSNESTCKIDWVRGERESFFQATNTLSRKKNVWKHHKVHLYASSYPPPPPPHLHTHL